MRSNSTSLPEPGSLRYRSPPHWHGLPGVRDITWLFLAAALMALIGGTILFGWSGARVLGASVTATLLVEAGFNTAARRPGRWVSGQGLLIGALMACTLPPQVAWEIPALGGAMAVAISRLLGGLGNQLWHPVVIGRLGVQILFHDELTPATWPVLASGRLLVGTVDRARPLPPACDWGTHTAPNGVDAWSVVRTVDALPSPLPAEDGADPGEALAALIRDVLPPWQDTLTGVAGGAMGEACALALIAGGMLLLWRGILRWPMLLSCVATALLAAAILPVRLQADAGAPTFSWLPVTAMHEGLPVGAVYLLYHLTAGEFLLVLLLLAPAPDTSPLTRRGHLWFGASIGLTTMALRILLMLPAAGYWALLLANTLVPLINRLTRRRVSGT